MKHRPYYSLNEYLRELYGQKVYKLALDGGMTCPNRDGHLGTRGCIFCNAAGSGDFAAPSASSVTEQITNGIRTLRVAKRSDIRLFIAYFQSFTNTYAPIDKLRSLFTEAILHPDIVGLSIATRPDCLGDEVITLLVELNQIKPVWIELGLQTIHESTASFIRRGYPLSVFNDAVKRLHANNLITIVHIILGLPKENTPMVLETIDYLNNQPIQGIKLQLLHVLKNTDLADYLATMHILSEDEYLTLLGQCLARLRPDLVIHRITGDGPGDQLLAPLWSLKKRKVLNDIHHFIKQHDIWQGKDYSHGKQNTDSL